MFKQKYLYDALLIAGALIPELSVAQTSAMGSGNDAIREEVREFVIQTIRTQYFSTAPFDTTLPVEAMVNKLDPFSCYVTKAKFERDLLEQNNEQFAYGFHFVVLYHQLVISSIDPGSDLLAKALPGDEIAAIDGVPVRDSIPDALLPADRAIDLTLYRPSTSDTIDAVIRRKILPDPSVGPYGMLDDSTAFIKITEFTKGTSERLGEVLDSLVQAGENSGLQCDLDTYYDRLAEARFSLYRNNRPGYRATWGEIKDYVRARFGRTLKSLVIDLRGNPGGYVKEVIGCLSLFTDNNGEPLITVRTRSGVDKYFAKASPRYPELRLAVLVDNYSCSASEIFAGVLQDVDRAVIIGEPTIGKALVMRYLDVPNGDKLFLAIGEYVLPSGRIIQRPFHYDTIVGGAERMFPNLDNRDHAIDGAISAGSCTNYLTKQGRKLNGAEGIIPDYIVSENFWQDHPKWFLDALWRATIPYLQRNIAWLRTLSLDSIAHLPIPQSVTDSSLEYASASDTSRGHTSTANDASEVPAIERWILAYSLWQDQGWFEVRLRQEAALRRAMEILRLPRQREFASAR